MDIVNGGLDGSIARPVYCLEEFIVHGRVTGARTRRTALEDLNAVIIELLGINIVFPIAI